MTDPQLIAARERIKAVIEDLDIAAYVVMHNAPGQFEIYSKLDPSYSGLTGMPPAVRLRDNLGDHGGDIQAHRRAMMETAEMVRGFSASLTMNALQLMELAAWIEARTGIGRRPLEPDNETTGV